MGKMTNDDILCAIFWLESHQGEDSVGGDRDKCCRVAAHLRDLLDRRGAAALGCNVAYYRRIMKAN